MLKLKRLTKAEWFDYEDGIKVLIRPMPMSIQMEIASKYRKRAVIYDSPEDKSPENRIFVDDMDSFSFTMGLFDYALVDWEGDIEIEVDGKSLTKEEVDKSEKLKTEAKRAFFDFRPIRDFILEKARELAEEKEAEFKDELKN